MKQKIFALLVLLLVSRLGYAGDWFHDAIKVDKPNQLAYWVEVQKICPITQETVQKLVEGVFIRSRIKPLGEKLEGISLDVELACIKMKDNRFVYKLEIYFSRYLPLPAVNFAMNFGAHGIGKDTDITAAIKEQVETAITEYIKANFDL